LLRGVVAGRMSAIVKRVRAGQKHSPATAVLVALGFVVVVFFLVTYGQQLLMEHGLKDKAAAQRIANAALRDENSRLKSSLLYYQSDKYIEQRAREDLNLRRPEEEIIVPIRVAPDTSSGSPTAIEKPVTTIPPNTATDGEVPNWQKWLNLFAPN
jgi:cell division protein FtsB